LVVLSYNTRIGKSISIRCNVYKAGTGKGEEESGGERRGEERREEKRMTSPDDEVNCTADNVINQLRQSALDLRFQLSFLAKLLHDFGSLVVRDVEVEPVAGITFADVVVDVVVDVRSTVAAE
jgi:hypothetical protein